MRRPRLTSSGLKNILASVKRENVSDGALRRAQWLLFFAEHNNVSLTCRHFAIARSTFLRWLKRFDPNDLQSLEEESRRPHSVRQPETDNRVIELIKEIRTTSPMMGKEQIADILKSKHRIEISSSTVGRVIARHQFFFGNTKSHQSKRCFKRTIVAQERAGSTFDDTTSDLIGLVPGVTS
jgi:transposase